MPCKVVGKEIDLAQKAFEETCKLSEIVLEQSCRLKRYRHRFIKEIRDMIKYNILLLKVHKAYN